MMSNRNKEGDERKMWFKHSLKGKLSLLLLVAIVFPLLGAGVVTYRIASNLTEKNRKAVRHEYTPAAFGQIGLYHQ
jgi:hypothetical protein